MTLTPTGQRAAVPILRRASSRAIPVAYPPRGSGEPRFRAALPGYLTEIVTQHLHAAGLRGWLFHTSALATIVVCVGLWIRAKTVDQEERGNAERRALFAGLWAPTLWAVGNSLESRELGGRAGRRRGGRRPSLLRGR